MIDQDIEKQFVSLTETIDRRFFGKYRGKVKNIGKNRNDLGIITVEVPEIFPEKEIPLVKPVIPFAGKNCGFGALPKKDDVIWIEFEAGNLNKPIWTGFWWAEGEEPEAVDWDTVALVSRTGHKLILDDKMEKMSLVHSKGPEINLTAEEITFRIGNTKMVISDSGVKINDTLFEVKRTP
jgi:Type VI secretion system/phage-baseplate injector OB domain